MTGSVLGYKLAKVDPVTNCELTGWTFFTLYIEWYTERCS